MSAPGSVPPALLQPIHHPEGQKGVVPRYFPAAPSDGLRGLSQPPIEEMDETWRYAGIGLVGRAHTRD
jgi:hypothetical protein